MSKIKPAAPSNLQMLILWMISIVSFRSNFIRKKSIVIGEIIDFQDWVKENFQDSKLFFKREELWVKMIKNSTNNRRIIELGVAWGYTTQWFLKIGYPIKTKTLNSKSPSIKIDSFDLFTGLPEAWRNYPGNYFYNNGAPPEIDDERVTFHVGFVESTIKNLELAVLAKEELVVLFDLDLYQPTLESYKYLKPALKMGDLLYFDEAFDSDERKILKDHVLNDFVLTPIGHTALAICLRIEEARH
jgi:hypothetical protein